MFCSKCGTETADDAVFCANCGASLTGRKPAKKTKWATVAAILDIVVGGMSAASILMCLIIFLTLVVGDEEIPLEVVIPLAVMVVLSLLGVVGGIFALRRKNWVMALIGAIALVPPTLLLGLAAVVFTVMAKDEFE